MSEAEVVAHFPRGSDKLDLSGLKPTELTRLYCMKGGHHLQLLPEGSVRGSRDEHDPYSVLRIKSVSAGVVVIEGTEAKRFLSMSEDGKLYGSLSVTDESYFLEKMEENHYNTYKSQKYGPDWYLGIKKNGKPKRGSRTHIGQKAIFFLPRQVEQG
ncbi:putative fibroblast growth factor 1 [Ictalurus punctatus]|uniref:Fibroblast growth factor n=1 Tax=Ictalurus punctatus TaxID=7998 RepID=E3TF24_ICTPU|nr:putative fibroblast growth factor 1 [Ictalurus punctatus]ADO28910.1 putative heparin-binding growth factor 1 [Ictalurus punctatus]